MQNPWCVALQELLACLVLGEEHRDLKSTGATFAPANTNQDQSWMVSMKLSPVPSIFVCQSYPEQDSQHDSADGARTIRLGTTYVSAVPHNRPQVALEQANTTSSRSSHDLHFLDPNFQGLGAKLLCHPCFAAVDSRDSSPAGYTRDEGLGERIQKYTRAIQVENLSIRSPKDRQL